MTITTPDTGPAVDVELDILRYGLTEVAREMLDSLMRSAFSPVCRDILDCTSAIHMRTDDGWETVALWEGCMQHAFTAPHIANFVMDEWDIDSMQPGDVIFVNDPWRGTIHQSDVNLLRPVFVDGRVEFLLHSTSHLVDLGGAIPGGFSNGTQTHFEEQLKLPPTLLYANDVPVRPLFNFILENNRVPQLVLGDLRALHGCLVVGERQLQDLIARGGLAKVRAAGRFAIEATEASMARYREYSGRRLHRRGLPRRGRRHRRTDPGQRDGEGARRFHGDRLLRFGSAAPRQLWHRLVRGLALHRGGQADGRPVDTGQQRHAAPDRDSAAVRQRGAGSATVELLQPRRHRRAGDQRRHPGPEPGDGRGIRL